MIFYKTISAQPILEPQTFEVNGAIFNLYTSNSIEFPVKVSVENETQDLISKLENTDGVVIINLQDFNAL